MQVILAAVDKGETVSAKLIHERVSYGDKVTISAIISSIRYLDFHGFLVRKRSSLNQPYKIMPTLKAYQHFRPGPTPGIEL